MTARVTRFCPNYNHGPGHASISADNLAGIKLYATSSVRCSICSTGSGKFVARPQGNPWYVAGSGITEIASKLRHQHEQVRYETSPCLERSARLLRAAAYLELALAELVQVSTAPGRSS